MPGVARLIRILHISDSHLGAYLPPRPRRDIPRRGDDLINSFRTALATAVRESVDLVIHTGDLFHSPAPSSSAIMAAAEPLLAAATSGIHVLLLGGRHDGGLAEVPLLLAHRNVHFVNRPTSLEVECHGMRVGITAVPHIGQTTPERFVDAMHLARCEHTPGDIRILAVHEVFESAVRGPAGRRVVRGDEVVLRELVPAGFHYVAAGGVHRHQVLPTSAGMAITYAGSTDRIRFDERDESKGGVVVEWSDGRITSRFVEHRVRPMAALPLDVSGLKRGQIIDAVMGQVAGLPADAFAELRLTGHNTRAALASLDLVGRAREVRPDVLVHVAFQAVEIGGRRLARMARAGGAGGWSSAFGRLDGAATGVLVASRESIKLLPRCPGTYCLYDAGGRLLYVGKARELRTRVRCHLRAPRGDTYFSGWTRHIARIEARVACSELEALLVEAELVRRLRPPFNQQMRLWARYCYIAPGDRGGLAVHRRRPGIKPCFGPYRSVGWARAVLEAVRGHEQDPGLLAALAGVDDGFVCALEARLGTEASAENKCTPPKPPLGKGGREEPRLSEGVKEGGQSPENSQGGRDARPPGRPAQGDLGWRAAMVRGAFEQAALLREAEGLVGGLLILPGEVGTRRVVGITGHGLRFDVLRNEGAEAARVLEACRRPDKPEATGGRLRRSVVDSLRLIARQLRAGNPEYVLLSAKQVGEMGPEELLAAAFVASTRT